MDSLNLTQFSLCDLVDENITICLNTMNSTDTNGTSITECLQTFDYSENYVQYLVSNCDKPKRKISRPFVPAMWAQYIWSIIFGLMIFLAIIGNLAVIWTVMKFKEMKTITNLFLVNLSVADLLMASLNASFNFVFMLTSHWPFGEVCCFINNFLASATVAASVLTITATSIDRFFAIRYPLRPRISKRKAMVIIFGIWMVSSLISLPSLFFSKTHHYEYNNGYRVLCMIKWPDGLPAASEMDYIYNLVFFALTYLFPMITMGITYAIIGKILLSSERIGEMTTTQREFIRKKQKAVPMLITVTVIFGFCWLPYHLYFLITYHNTDIVKIKYVQHIYLAIYWFAMSNATINPMIYALLNKRFRSHFKAQINCKKSNSIQKSQMRHTNTTSVQFKFSIRS